MGNSNGNLQGYQSFPEYQQGIDAMSSGASLLQLRLLKHNELCHFKLVLTNKIADLSLLRNYSKERKCRQFSRRLERKYLRWQICYWDILFSELESQAKEEILQPKVGATPVWEPSCHRDRHGLIWEFQEIQQKTSTWYPLYFKGISSYVSFNCSQTQADNILTAWRDVKVFRNNLLSLSVPGEVTEEATSHCKGDISLNGKAFCIMSTCKKNVNSHTQLMSNEKFLCRAEPQVSNQPS